MSDLPDQQRCPVDRCACMDVTFARMKDYADSHNATFADLQKQFSCGRGCALCVPYVKAMLRTGRTRFPVDVREIDLNSNPPCE